MSIDTNTEHFFDERPSFTMVNTGNPSTERPFFAPTTIQPIYNEGLHLETIISQNTNQDGEINEEELVSYLEEISTGRANLTSDDIDVIFKTAIINYPGAVGEAQREAYLNEIVRHFENRVKTDPNREPARSCLQGPISDAILREGFQKLMDLGANIYNLSNQEGIVMVYKNIVAIFNTYKGKGQNAGTIFIADEASLQNGKLSRSLNTKPLSLDTANGKLTNYVNGVRCDNQMQPVPIELQVPSDQKQQQTANISLRDVPGAIPAIALSAVILLALMKGVTRKIA